MQRPDIVLILKEGLPEEIESEFRNKLAPSNLDFAITRQRGGPYAGVELYLPTAIALFVAAGFFNGVLQELGKDAYVNFKAAAVALWQRTKSFRITAIGSKGKVSQTQPYSLAFSITGVVSPGLNFKLLIQAEIEQQAVEAGISAFLELIDNLLHERVTEDDVAALLTYKPVGGTVLVTFDALNRKIVPVNAFEGRSPPLPQPAKQYI